MFERSLVLPEPGSETFFLWGPRQAGKSTLLKGRYPDAYWVDLLKSEEFRRYLDHPEFLRQELRMEPPAAGRQIVIDEVRPTSCAACARASSCRRPTERTRGGRRRC